MTPPTPITMTATIGGNIFAGLTVSMNGTADEPEQLARELNDVLQALACSADAARLNTTRQRVRVTLDKLSTEVAAVDAAKEREKNPDPAPEPEPARLPPQLAAMKAASEARDNGAAVGFTPLRVE